MFSLDSNFVTDQRKAQAIFFARTGMAEYMRPGQEWRLSAGRRDLNLAPSIRVSMKEYFGPPRKIAWHRHSNHGLSSQVCCLNFLGPLATEPKLLSAIVGNALGIEPPTMLPIEEGPDGQPWFVGFEWTGRANYLNEWAKSALSATRGANATSADAVVRFQHGKTIETLLIEWKYTEKYGAPISADGNPTRTGRYADKAFAPNGPIRADCGLSISDFFWEPFYQLMRQQTLAWQMTQAREDGAERVRVLHISPKGNRALHKVTSPGLKKFGDDAFDVFREILVNGDDFLSLTTDEVFSKFLAMEHHSPAAIEWARYLKDRYGLLFESL